MPSSERAAGMRPPRTPSRMVDPDGRALDTECPFPWICDAYRRAAHQLQRLPSSDAWRAFDTGDSNQWIRPRQVRAQVRCAYARRQGSDGVSAPGCCGGEPTSSTREDLGATSTALLSMHQQLHCFIMAAPEPLRGSQWQMGWPRSRWAWTRIELDAVCIGSEL